MSFSLLRITELYPQFIEACYKSNPHLSELSYKEQTQYLTQHSVEISSSYVKEFEKLGIPAHELITNASITQKQWAKENNINLETHDWAFILKQIAFFNCDIVWIDTTSLLNKDFISAIKKKCRKVKKVVGHICAPFNIEIENGLKTLDAVFTCTPCIEHELKSKGLKNVFLIYHAFFPEIIDWVKKENNSFPDSDFVFTGSLYTGYGLHKTRIEYLEALITNRVNVSIYGNLEPRSTVLKKQAMYYALNTLEKLNAEGFISKNKFLSKYRQYGKEKIKYYSKDLIRSTRPPVFGLDMYKVLSKSKICFNIHGDIAGNCAGNIRLFEATGIGSCLLTDYKQNLNQLFEINTEVVVYSNLNDCIEKVKWLLNNPQNQKEIALAGQKRVLNSHTVAHRVEQVQSILTGLLK